MKWKTRNHRGSSRNLNIPNKRLNKLIGGSSLSSFSKLGFNKRWSGKIDHQEEILFDANDQSYATPIHQSFIEVSVQVQDNTENKNRVYNYEKNKFLNLTTSINLNIPSSSLASVSKQSSRVNLKNEYLGNAKSFNNKPCKTSLDTYMNNTQRQENALLPVSKPNPIPIPKTSYKKYFSKGNLLITMP